MTRDPNAASAWRGWCYLVWLSFQRHRAHLMVWIALALLAFTFFIVLVNTQTNRWNMGRWGHKGASYEQHLDNLQMAGSLLPEPAAALASMAEGAWRTAVFHGTGLFIFSNFIVFSLFSTFLLPLWTLSFATEGLGREREGHNLLWVLTRPLPRPAIYLGKFLALAPWCLALSLGGFAVICLAAGPMGRLALQLYWPAVFWGTLAFASLFHMLGACVKRAAIVALLYAFFIETIMGNMPGQFKRLSISFYTRCLMFDRAHEFGIRPERPGVYLPVSGTVAWLTLAGVTVFCLVVGAWLFTRNEDLDIH